jgi:release factor glutamine methyltransferase
LSIHQRVIKECLPFLRPGGSLLFEIGLGQDRQVKMLFERAKVYEQIGLCNNAQGEARVISARRKAE